MGRVERVVAAGGNRFEVVGASTAWRAAEIVTEAFERPDQSVFVHRARLVGNHVRLRLITPSLINRDRTAVVGAGGVRFAPVVVTAVLAGWLGPRLPRLLQLAVVGVVAVGAVQRNRLRRMLWVTRAIRRHAPDALIVGEFSSVHPGAGIAFAVELVETLGPYTALAATVQGPVGNRRARAQVRMYERRLGFEAVDRHVVGDDEIVLLIRLRSALPGRSPVASAG